MKIYVGITDWDWYNYLRDGSFTEVNFWKPGGGSLKAISKGDLFLFKLKAAHGGRIAGGGFFEECRTMSIDWAWHAFERENGADNLVELGERIRRYRKDDRVDLFSAQIGCIILSDVFWFDDDDWFEAPGSWNAIVTGKTYDTDDPKTADGAKWLFEQVQAQLKGQVLVTRPDADAPAIKGGYKLAMAKQRVGQGVFRVRVADAYGRRCAVTGERTFPVLQAAHIQAFSADGPNAVDNGLLLRSDVHTLFDAGYLTVTDDLRVEVSRRLHDDWENGREYYALHGRSLAVVPDAPALRPSPAYLDWHHEHVFRG